MLNSNMHVELNCPINLIQFSIRSLDNFFKNIFNKIRIIPYRYMLRTHVRIYNIYVGPINAVTFSLDTSV